MATARSPRSRSSSDSVLAAVAGGAAVIVVSVALGTGELLSSGATALAAATFGLVLIWCVFHRRVDQTLAVLALYLGLLDGFVKLRTGSSTITLARDLIVASIAAGALLRSTVTGSSLRFPPLSGFVVAFCAAVLVELLNPDARGVTGTLAGLRQNLEFVPLFFLGYAFLDEPEHLRKFLFILVICAAAGGIVSYVQSQLTPEQLAGWGAGYRERIFGTGAFSNAGRVSFGPNGVLSVRPFGLGSEVGSGAVAAALGLPALLALLVTDVRRRSFLVVMGIGIGLAVVSSGSRAAIVGVFISVIAFGMLAATSKNALRAIAGIAVGATLVAVVVQQVGQTASTERAKSIAPTKALATFSSERGDSVGQIRKLIREHPFGVGVGTAGPARSVGGANPFGNLNAETQWNFLVIETGVAGLVVFVALLLRLIALAAVRIRRLPDPTVRMHLAALAGPLVGLLALGFAGPTTASVPSAPYLWLVSGVLSSWLISSFRQRRPD